MVEPVDIRPFYEAHPFPNAQVENEIKLRELADSNAFLVFLDRVIGDRSRVLEVGCGTGHLSHFLAMRRTRDVVGLDLSEASVAAARVFTRRTTLGGSPSFRQMDLFAAVGVVPPADVVLCMGVLHHLADPAAGFTAVSRLVAPGGMLVVGLYNKFGRARTSFLRQLRVPRRVVRFLDDRLDELSQDPMKPEESDAWWWDQYRHPRETSASMAGLRAWYVGHGLEPLCCLPEHPVPVVGPGRPLLAQRSTARSRAWAQARLLLRPGDGGYMVMIGCRSG